MAATPTLTPRVRAAGVAPDPLLPVGSAASRSASAVATELGRVLNAHADEAKTISSYVARDPPSGAPDADAAALAMLEQVAKLQLQASAYLDAARKPSGSGVQSAAAIADECLTCLDRKLDKLEARLGVLYDLPKVVVQEEPEEERQSSLPRSFLSSPKATAGLGTPSTSTVCGAKSLHEVATPVDTASQLKHPTPRNPTRLSPPTPSTPNMQDFGIDDTALESFAAPILYHRGSAKKPLPNEAPYEDIVERSMDALHIAPVSGFAEDELHTPPLPPTPPNVDLPPLFTPVLSKAGADVRIPATPPRPKSPSRALTFDTPDTAAIPNCRITRSQTRKTAAQALRRETREVIQENLHSLSSSSFLLSKFDEKVICDACDLLHDAHEKQGTSRPLTISRDQVSRILHTMPAVQSPDDAKLLLYTLSKLTLIEVEVGDGSGGTSYTFGRRR